jgi:hypothetical protein
MSVIHLFPNQSVKQPEPTVDVADEALHELLRQAVVAHGARGLRQKGSFGARHHLAIAHAYLHAVEIMLGKPDLKVELARCLDVGIHDIRQLARVARTFAPGPAAA